MRLNEIADKPGARKARTRVGRGIGSGSGKTAGRGTKGQKSRSGVSLQGFEGGQMPLHRRLPKRGFTNINAKRYAELGLDRLQEAVDKKQLDASKPVTEAVLKGSGVITHLRDGVRVLGNGEIKTKLVIEVTGATRSAVAAIEAAGGSITVTRPPREKPPAKDNAKDKGKGKGKAKAKASGEAKADAAPAVGQDAAAAADDRAEDTADAAADDAAGEAASEGEGSKD